MCTNVFVINKPGITYEILFNSCQREEKVVNHLEYICNMKLISQEGQNVKKKTFPFEVFKNVSYCYHVEAFFLLNKKVKF